MKTAKRWAYRFMLGPQDRTLMCRFVTTLERRTGIRLHTTQAMRLAILLVDRERPKVPYRSAKVAMATAQPWSLLLSGEDSRRLTRIRKHYGLRYRNETLVFILRALDFLPIGT